MTGIVSGQRPGMGDGTKRPADGIIKGIVLDKSGEIPMEYANIVLYSQRDSSIVSGTVTGPDGHFILENLPYGRFYAIANFIGYNKKYIRDIKITPQSKVLALDPVLLEMASTALEGVEINADKAHVEYKIDKKIVNVSQDIMAQGGSAVAVLENTPSVQVDIEGNVSMRGTSNFTVLIDGRPSVLEGSDALQQIPASTIDHIEIITNPSAKYDPDGVGGIINVVLKKQKQPGTNGVVNVGISSGNKYKSDVLLNYRRQKFNIFGGADFNHNEFSMRGRSEYTTYLTDSTSYRYSDMKGEMTRKGYGFKAGTDYYINDDATLTFSGQYGTYGFGRDHSSTNTLWTVPQSLKTYTLSESESNRDGTYYNLNMNYLRNFKGAGHKLEVLGYYSKRNGNDAELQNDYITDAAWIDDGSNPESIKTSEESDNDEFRISTDYTRPFGEEGKLETGYQSRFDFENEKYIFEQFDYFLNDYVQNDLYTSQVNFKRNIHSIYGTYSNTAGSWGYQLGLRGEFTDRNIKDVDATAGYVINRFDYFPTLHLSKQFESDHQLLASYSRRIDRPHGWALDPFVNYIDAYNIRIGNPALEPEYIDSYELSYQKRLKKSFISLETYYRVDKNKITRIKSLQEDGTIVHTFQNLNRDYSLGAELMVNADLSRWLQMNGSVNVYNYWLEGNVEDEDVSTGSTNWDGRMNVTLKLKYDFRVQLTGFYRGPSVTAQGQREGFFMSNMAIRKDLFQKKFSATISVRDMFDSAKREMTTSGPGFTSYDLFKREAPIVSLNLSYIINNYKRQRTGEMQDEGGQEDGEVGY